MAVFFLPIVINSVHDILNHEHAVCISKVEQHIHQKDLDCNLHLYKQSSSFLATDSFNILTKTIILNSDSIKYSFLKNHYRLSFSLRGPPLYIQS
ncbi:hypothetical protein [uncultured Polaribacter sp.]|uniref:hypothetical protein n=1 Tax=uncultured Polaribacter sp. TaxID=174711 RepID=UPI002616503A|nr:hypothetical protein [uncultured Polaribacter sp.]